MADGGIGWGDGGECRRLVGLFEWWFACLLIAEIDTGDGFAFIYSHNVGPGRCIEYDPDGHCRSENC